MVVADDLKAAIDSYRENPNDSQELYRLESAYWGYVTDSISELARNGADVAVFLAEQQELLDYGLREDLNDDYEEVKKELSQRGPKYQYLTVRTVTGYLKEALKSITQGGRKQMVEEEVRIAEMQLKRVEDEIRNLRKSRRETVMEVMSTSGRGSGAQREAAGAKHAGTMEQVDKWLLQSSETKKAISQGVFVSVDKRRQHAQREKRLDSEQGRIDTFLNGLNDKEGVAEIRRLSKSIVETIDKRVKLKDSLDKLRRNIEQIERERNAISPLEVANRLSEEITYLRDLVKLSAKRLRTGSCPLLRSGETFFTRAKLVSALERIVEFDPLLFRNDRVSLFGRPSILLVPGVGNALYDWKHNQLIVPLIPYQKNDMVSIATGIIEYRLDVDEDKKLLNSYSQLPDYKTIKSMFQLKGKLSKDYITWMTSEYKGFRVLPSAVKKWFDHEIAPNRTEIFTPPQYQPFALSASDFKDKVAQTEGRLSVLEEANEEDLWAGSIFSYQQGKYKRAIELLNALLRKNPEHVFAYFNLGQICVKDMRKQEAIAAFGEFTKRKTQSWWTALARDLMRQLQMG